jgi:ABC-type lipoprotein export system ATPase subunit
MGRLAWSQARFRLARTLALIAGVLVAATAFTVLTAASQTAQLRTTGEVSAHFSPAYDILVRPRGARTAVENKTGTVQPDFLSGIYGGITMTQCHKIQQVPGVHYRRTVGFVFQRYNLLPALTALDNIIAPVLPYRTRWDKRARARDLLVAVGLAGREGSLPSRMSGGEQQRIAIARALINTPALLLADEPTGNLDSGNAAEILDLLARLRAEHDMTIVLVSHDPQIAARAERLIRLRDGAVIDDIQLTGNRLVQDVIRDVGQLG